MSSIPTDAWWQPHEVPPGHTLTCRIGPLAIDIHHAPGEWQLAHRHEGDESGAPADAFVQLREGGLGDDVEPDRFMVIDPDSMLKLTPRLLDRPVVIRPRQPVFLPQGEETTLFMSTPLMLSIAIGDAARVLREIPSQPLSDTWFGPSTREGELCYAGRTHARHARDELPRRAHRVVTPVRIRNDADMGLQLDKVSLPVQVLSVFGAEDGTLWTEAVSLSRTAVSELAALEVDDEAPESAGAVQLLCEPRQRRTQGSLVRAFSALFGDGT